MLCFSLLRFCSIALAAWIYEPSCCFSLPVPGGFWLKWVEELATAIALIAACVGSMAQRAFTLDEAISQETGVGLTVRLDGHALFNEAVCPQFSKYILDNLCMLGRWGLAKYVKVYSKPVIYLLVNFVIFCA